MVSWAAIHRERFPLTPTAIYAELCKNAQVLLQRHGADALRRSARLALVEEEEETSQEEAPHPGLKPLRYTEVNGPDLEVFKLKQASKPPGWNRAVAQASEIHIDNMRSMLELHYDEVHSTEWVQNHNTKRAPARDSEF